MDRFCGICGTPLNADGSCPRCGAGAAPAAASGLKISGPKKAAAPGAEAAKGAGLKVSGPGSRAGAPAAAAAGAAAAVPAGKKKAEKPKAEKKAKASGKKAKPGKKGGVKIAVFALLALLLAFLILGALQYFGVLNIPFMGRFLGLIGLNRGEDESHQPPADYLVEPIVAEDYFNENGKILNRTPAKDSANLHTEAEAAQNLEGRGFTMYPVLPVWTMEGEKVEGNYAEVGGTPTYSTTTKHPMYTTYYLNTNNELWTVTEINGVVAAIPVTYNNEYAPEAQVIFVENDSVMSYDATTNMFYETVPNRTALIAYRIDRIDAAALDELTAWEIDRR